MFQKQNSLDESMCQLISLKCISWHLKLILIDFAIVRSEVISAASYTYGDVSTFVRCIAVQFARRCLHDYRFYNARSTSSYISNTCQIISIFIFIYNSIIALQYFDVVKRICIHIVRIILNSY